VSTTRVNRHIRASRADVYRALLDPAAVQQWMVPEHMTSHVHEFDARADGRFRISLRYDAPTDAGKSDAGKSDPQTDTFHGRFLELNPNTRVVQEVEFESDDPQMQGLMTVTYALADAREGGTDLAGVHEHLPPGVSLADNELGWRMSLDKLAALVERDHSP
jgi:uncharacterized protein YndB with AHSA1/START domain